MISNCAKCGTPVDVPDAFATELFACPNCAHEQRVPKNVLRQKSPAPPPVNTRLVPCHDCQREISRIANSCPHCGRMIFPVQNLAELLVKFGLALVLLVVFGVIALAFILRWLRP